MISKSEHPLSRTVWALILRGKIKFIDILIFRDLSIHFAIRPFLVGPTCSSCHNRFNQFPFIAFACKHSFHKDCLITQLPENSREGFLKWFESRRALVNELYEQKLEPGPVSGTDFKSAH